MTKAAHFAALYEKAAAAGHAAALAAKPTTMIVGGAKIFGFDGTGAVQVWNDPNTYVEPEGPCGFAWIKFKGNTAWANWAKKNAKVSSAHPTGLMIWVGAYGQSMQRKEAYARAFAKVLNEGGVEAFAESRID